MPEELEDLRKRLIEDYLPIQAVGVAASSEPRTKGHLSTLHIWRARRPLMACRAAVYSALVPADQFAPPNAPSEKRVSLARANAARFVERLCTYPGDPRAISDAQKHILEAHAGRLTKENGKTVTPDDIVAGRAARPKVLDLFAGGGAIPLEAARLGCEAHAVELNPVAHLIELCTVTFPQQFGRGLADEVESWGKRVLEGVRVATQDLYPQIPIPGHTRVTQADAFSKNTSGQNRYHSIVAHYWTRTVPCQRPDCQAAVPLYRQTWLRKKESGYVALRPEYERASKKVRFRVVEAQSEAALGFDPGEGSEGSATVCPFCQTALDAKYVRSFGDSKGFGQQLMCVIALNPHGTGKAYLTGDSLAEGEAERQRVAEERARVIEQELGSSSLDEVIPPTGNAGLATGKSYLYGIRTFRQAFTPRQRCVLLTMAREIRTAHRRMLDEGIGAERAQAITTYLGLWLSRLTDRFNALSRWDNSSEKIQGLTSMKRFSMAWDFPEVNIFGGASGDALGNLEFITAVIRQEGQFRNPARCFRGSATELPYDAETFDAVVTDPPYYDNESYSELSDVCYVWLRPTIGFLYPEHFAGNLTPKKQECVAAAYRQGGTEADAHRFYEDCLFRALKEAHRVTKRSGLLVLVYAHKTTAGWATLVDAIRRAEFEVAEAWPLDTEAKARVAHQGDAALASSIFLVARKRAGPRTGVLDETLHSDLAAIVKERVATLWELGVTGADLVIACVGAGLRAFTRYARVEFANGEEVPAERFLAEVETVVLETILDRLSKQVGGNSGQHSLAGVDPATRFYILWRYAYASADLDAGEAIIFANGTHVELDGQSGVASGQRALVEKTKSKYRLRDYAERGEDAKLGLPADAGQPAPLVDALHRTLWLVENQPLHLPEFLREAQPNREQMRLVAQALAGPALKGGELDDVSSGGELAALAKLTANWRSLMEEEALPMFEPRKEAKP